jgi:hypothetical protein
MLNDEVGKFIALGGHAYHLKDAVSRIQSVVRDHGDHEVAKRMADYIDAKAVGETEEKPAKRPRAK